MTPFPRTATLPIVAAGLLVAPAPLAIGQIVAPIGNTFSEDFQAPNTEGQLNIGPNGSNGGAPTEYYSATAGEISFFGTFGASDAEDVFVEVAPDIGPAGIGDSAAFVAVGTSQVPFDDLNYFAGQTVTDNGFYLLPDLAFPDPDPVNNPTLFLAQLDWTVQLDINAPAGSTVRIRLESGHFDGDRTPENISAGSIGIDHVAAGGWETVSFTGNDLGSNGVDVDPPFIFDGREPVGDQAARVTVVYPAPVGAGTVFIDNVSVTGTAVQVAARGDLNHDAIIDQADIDDMFKAINAWAAVGGIGGDPLLIGTTLLEQQARANITPAAADTEVDNDDLTALIETILGSTLGDFDLDGTADTDDRDTIIANDGMMGGYAMGDINGDMMIDAADLAAFDALGSGPLLGDMNVDGLINFDDIDPFVLGLTDPVAYDAMFGQSPIVNGDINGDLAFNFDDIDPFIAILTGGGPAVPEPASLALLTLGGVLALRRRR